MEMVDNSIAFAKNHTGILDKVYQRSAVSTVLNSGRRIARAGHNARDIMIPKIEVTGLGDCVRDQGYKTGAITFSCETMVPNYDCEVRLMADVMDVEEGGVLDAFVAADSELQRPRGRRIHLRYHRLARGCGACGGGPLQGHGR